jgi:hypothetical protein
MVSNLLDLDLSNVAAALPTRRAWESRPRPHRALSDDDLAALEAERREAVAAAKDWTTTAFTALTQAAHRTKGAVAVMGPSSGSATLFRGVSIDVGDPRAPAHLRQLQAAYEDAQRAESAAKAALRAVTHEQAMRRQEAAHAAIAARSAGQAEAREAARRAALRQAVTDASRRSLMDRVRAVIGE